MAPARLLIILAPPPTLHIPAQVALLAVNKNHAKYPDARHTLVLRSFISWYVRSVAEMLTIDGDPTDDLLGNTKNTRF